MIIPSSILPVIQDPDDTHICKDKDSQRILRAKESRPDANCDLSALQIDTKMFPSSSQVPFNTSSLAMLWCSMIIPPWRRSSPISQGIFRIHAGIPFLHTSPVTFCRLPMLQLAANQVGSYPSRGGERTDDMVQDVEPTRRFNV